MRCNGRGRGRPLSHWVGDVHRPLPESEDIGSVYGASDEYLAKFSLLYFRVLAKLAAIAEVVEAAEGLQPMVDAIIASPRPDEVE